jgi:hypothetical protein
MKRKAAILTLMMIFTFAACGVQPAESTNVGADTSQVSTPAISNDTTLATLPADSEPDSSAATTTVETTAATTKQESPICGLYRSTIPEHEGGDDYDYIWIQQLDDGTFQVEMMPVSGGTGNDYAHFDTEELGTGYVQSFTFDPDIYSPGYSLTITVEGDSAWVTHDGGEPIEFVKEEE